MKVLKFEKVGDINFKYPYIEVFFEKEDGPLMEIGIKDNKELHFTIYKTNTVLTLQQWEEILGKSKEFHFSALKDEDFFEKFMQKKER